MKDFNIDRFYDDKIALYTRNNNNNNNNQSKWKEFDKRF